MTIFENLSFEFGRGAMMLASSPHIICMTAIRMIRILSMPQTLNVADYDGNDYVDENPTN